MNWAIWKRGIIAFAVLILNSCATPGSGGLRPSQSEFDSQWVEIAAGSAYGEIGKPLALMLILKNKTDRALWVHVGFTSPDPAQSCTSAKQLAPKGSATYTCAQRQLVADVPYPISVAAFSDQALTQNLETKQTKLRAVKTNGTPEASAARRAARTRVVACSMANSGFAGFPL